MQGGSHSMNVVEGSFERVRDQGQMMPARIGGTGAVMTRDAVLAWVETAPTGRELAYAEGSLPGWSKTPATVRDLDDRGIVFAFYDGKKGQYVIRRLSAPYTPARQPMRIAREIAPSADDKARLLKVLRAEAKAGQPCSSNKVLAIKAGLKDADRASYLLKLLVKDGAIRNDATEWKPGRRITIVATGDRTHVAEGTPR